MLILLCYLGALTTLEVEVRFMAKVNVRWLHLVPVCGDALVQSFLLSPRGGSYVVVFKTAHGVTHNVVDAKIYWAMLLRLLVSEDVVAEVLVLANAVLVCSVGLGVHCLLFVDFVG